MDSPECSPDDLIYGLNVLTIDQHSLEMRPESLYMRTLISYNKFTSELFLRRKERGMAEIESGWHVSMRYELGK